MKNLLLILSLTFLAISCKDTCKQTITYTLQEPIWISKADFDAQNGKWLPAKLMQKTGKIFVYGQYVLISEPNKGIHFIDNRNPEKPKNIGFLEVFGNIDIALKNNLLYVDSYQDLLCFDLSDITQPKKISIQKGIFKNRFVHTNPTADSIAIAYKTKEITQTVKCGEIYPRCATNDMGMLPNGSAANAASPSSPNKAGSMAAFLVVGDYLYTVETNKLHVFSLVGSQTAQIVNSIDLGWGVETIFASEGKLFLGTMNGMRIFSLQNPQNPTFLGEYSHPIACDPVVVKGNTAFITTRSGNICGNAANQLDVVDIANPRQPRLLRTYPMLNPHGLAIEGNKLFICEGKYGFKQFDASSSFDIRQEKFIQNIDSFDIITLPQSFLLIGQDGLYQYNYDFSLLSKIETQP
jgi:hypothetical protein